MSREPSKEFLKERYDYHPDGHLIFKFNRGNQLLGKRAGAIARNGYVRASIQGKTYMLHRLIYAWHFGPVPEYLDHINGNRADNRIENLRPATRSLNGANRMVNKQTSSGIKGVRMEPTTGRWRAAITVLGKYQYLGMFDSPKEASDAYAKAASVHFGAFARR